MPFYFIALEIDRDRLHWAMCNISCFTACRANEMMMMDAMIALHPEMPLSIQLRLFQNTKL
jgi:hypothetical protein